MFPKSLSSQSSCSPGSVAPVSVAQVSLGQVSLEQLSRGLDSSYDLSAHHTCNSSQSL